MPIFQRLIRAKGNDVPPVSTPAAGTPPASAPANSAGEGQG